MDDDGRLPLRDRRQPADSIALAIGAAGRERRSLRDNLRPLLEDRSLVIEDDFIVAPQYERWQGRPESLRPDEAGSRRRRNGDATPSRRYRNAIDNTQTEITPRNNSPPFKEGEEEEEKEKELTGLTDPETDQVGGVRPGSEPPSGFWSEVRELWFGAYAKCYDGRPPPNGAVWTYREIASWSWRVAQGPERERISEAKEASSQGSKLSLPAFIANILIGRFLKDESDWVLKRCHSIDILAKNPNGWAPEAPERRLQVVK